jgi:histidine triad (HIT) family protein
MDGCLFCDIVAGRTPSHPVYETAEHLAFLDIYPSVRGQALVVTKRHRPSYVFGLADEEYSALLLAAKEVARLIDERLGALRTCMVMEGMEVDHAHIKLYPVYKVLRGVAGGVADLNEYPGYLTTLHGPRATDAELEEVSRRMNAGGDAR